MKLKGIFQRHPSLLFLCGFLHFHSLILSLSSLFCSFTRLACTLSAHPNNSSTIFPFFLPLTSSGGHPITSIFEAEFEKHFLLKISMLSILEISYLKENYPDITSMTNHNCHHERFPVSMCIFSICSPKNKRKENDTKCLAKNGCGARASVSLSSSGRRCPERGLSFYSENAGSKAMTDIFKLAAEKIQIIQVRFLNINGRKKILSKKLKREREYSMAGTAALMKLALLQICFSTCFSQSSTQYPWISFHLAKFTYMSLSSPTIVSSHSRSSNYQAGKRPDVL